MRNFEFNFNHSTIILSHDFNRVLKHWNWKMLFLTTGSGCTLTTTKPLGGGYIVLNSLSDYTQKEIFWWLLFYIYICLDLVFIQYFGYTFCSIENYVTLCIRQYERFQMHLYLLSCKAYLSSMYITHIPFKQPWIWMMQTLSNII